MNTAAVLRGTGHVAVPAALVLGTSLSTLAVIGTGPARPVAQAPPAATARPSPTAAAPQDGPTVRPHPSPRPTSAGTTVVSAGRDAAGSGRTGSSVGVEGGGATVRPSPTPQPPASDSSAVDVRAALRLTHPLGILPDARLALTVGGTDDHTG